jgi:protein tyrosine phosphatase
MTESQIEIIQSVADILNAVVKQMRSERHHRVRDEFQIESALKDATDKLHAIISEVQARHD